MLLVLGCCLLFCSLLVYHSFGKSLVPQNVESLLTSEECIRHCGVLFSENQNSLFAFYEVFWSTGGLIFLSLKNVLFLSVSGQISLSDL